MAVAPHVLTWLAVWLSANVLVSINVVTLHWARLVPGWVTFCRRVNYRYVISHPSQLSLVIPLRVGAMSTSLSLEGNHRSGIGLAMLDR